jgi:Zn-dependent protease
MKTLFLLFSVLKMGKVLTTGGTMLLSLVVYAGLYGWRYAVGFVGLLFAHEMGHYIAARRKGLNVGAPTFIPFVGAWVDLKDQPRDVDVEAYIAFAGPLVGTFAALAVYFVARSESSNLLLAIAYSGFFLNLFNLIPLPPFDGGRITAALSRKLWLIGVPVLIAVFVWNPSPLLILMAILAAPQVWAALKGQSEDNQAYYNISAQKRFEYGVLYLGLLVYLAIMTHDVHALLATVR